MPEAVLSDPDLFPSEEIIFRYIGKYQEHWKLLFDRIRERHPGLEGNWKYYRDGKSWLFKMTGGSETVFWLSLAERTFRITFYFNRKNEGFLLHSGVSEKIKKEYRDLPASKNFRPVTILVKSKTDVEQILQLTGIKVNAKKQSKAGRM